MSRVDEVVARLHGVRRRGALTMARCPAHDDAGPSLSVKEGVDGTVLVNCFAGCSFDAIAHALGISPTDFFPPKDPQAETAAMLTQSALRRLYRAATEKDQREIVQAQLLLAENFIRAGLVEDGAIDVASPLRAEHLNAARRRVCDLLGIDLYPLESFDWEYAPHDADPVWPMLYERALVQVVSDRWGRWQVAAAARWPHLAELVVAGPVTDPLGATRADRHAARSCAAEWLHQLAHMEAAA